jgi:hypothetical protein
MNALLDRSGTRAVGGATACAPMSPTGLSVISDSDLEWSLLEQQQTSGGRGAKSIGSV